ncbi:zinc finger protein 658-like, partial [Carlito syrichta]|uniref:Zinc finger protein 658-like n=1 Tax=Carlito syrichta TaxID=1868482 RepID=A0A1U7T4I1_CARSF
MLLKGSVSFEDVIVELTQEEWRRMGPRDRSLYRDVMLENYGHLVAVGCCITKPKVILKLEQGEEPWSLEVKFLNQKYPGYYKIDDHIKEIQEKPKKPVCQVIFADDNDKTLSKEEQKVLERPLNLGIAPEFSGKIPCKCDFCGKNLPVASELIISKRNDSRKKVDYVNVFQKLQLDFKHEKTHPGEKSYEYDENVKAHSYKKDQYQKFQTLGQSFEYNEFGNVLYDKTVYFRPETFVTREKSCKDGEFRINCDKTFLLNYMTTDTREKCSGLNECGKSCDKATILEYNKIHMAVTHHKFNESEINFSEKSSLIQSQRTVIEQSADESNKCEENFSHSSGHIVSQKTQSGRDKFCEYNECTNICYQKLDLTIHLRT